MKKDLNNIMTKIYFQADSIESPKIEIFENDSIGTTEPARVILYNDNIHTFDDVISQLIKAIHCSSDVAEGYAWEVHNKGKASVYEGDVSECLKVSGVLEEIALNTQIEM
jgi:ATP-dependent Clp protease adaptor protein ClpS